MEKNIYYQKYKSHLVDLISILESDYTEVNLEFKNQLEMTLNTEAAMESIKLTEALKETIIKDDMFSFEQALKEINETNYFELSIYENTINASLELLKKGYKEHFLRYIKLLTSKTLKLELYYEGVFNLFLNYLNEKNFTLANKVIDDYFYVFDNDIYKNFALYLTRNNYDSYETARSSNRRIWEDKLGKQVYDKYMKLDKEELELKIIEDDLDKIINHHRHESGQSTLKKIDKSYKPNVDLTKQISPGIITFKTILYVVISALIAYGTLYLLDNYFEDTLLFLFLPTIIFTIASLVVGSIFKLRGLTILFIISFITYFMWTLYDSNIININIINNYYEALKLKIEYVEGSKLTEIMVNELIDSIDSLKSLVNNVVFITITASLNAFLIIIFSLTSKVGKFEGYVRKITGVILMLGIILFLGYFLNVTTFLTTVLSSKSMFDILTITITIPLFMMICLYLVGSIMKRSGITAIFYLVAILVFLVSYNIQTTNIQYFSLFNLGGMIIYSVIYLLAFGIPLWILRYINVNLEI